MSSTTHPSYIIAATPRSGSFLLCEALARTGVAGGPREYAVAEEVQTWRDHYGYRTHVEYFYQFVAQGSSPNGVFGAKLMWSQLVGLCADIQRYLGVRSESRHTALRCLLGDVSYIRLVRRDRLRQAISLVRAMQSGVWNRKTNGLSEAPPDHYDREAIAWALQKIESETILWDAHLMAANCAAFTVVYEDFVDDYCQVIDDTVGWLRLGGPTPLPLGAPTLVRQADDLTDSWADRYLCEGR